MLCMSCKNATVRKKIVFQKELVLTKSVLQKDVGFAIIGTLKMLDLSLNHKFVTKVSHDVLMSSYKLKSIAILSVRGVDFRCILWGIGKDDAVNGLNNSVLEDAGLLQK